MKINPVIIGLALLATPLITSAHAVISPFQAPTQSYQDFSLSVPSEKEMATVGVRILMPTELVKATPFVKPGWKISVTKVNEAVTQIEWTGGNIPTHQKDLFQFTSVTPKENATLKWIVYQTYEDGTVVAWDRDPKTPVKEGEKVENPYSMTDVRSDVLPLGLPQEKSKPIDSHTSGFAIAAFALSVVALSLSFRKR